MQSELLWSDIFPSVYPLSTYMTRSLKSSPSILYCKQSKTEGGKGLEMRLSMYYVYTTIVIQVLSTYESITRNTRPFARNHFASKTIVVQGI